MPSMEQLKEFSSSFVNIGNEANSLSAGQYSRANFPLPDNEPPSPFPEDIAGIPETEPGLNDFDFSAFLNPQAPDIPAGPETEAAEFSPDLSGFGDSGSAEKSPNGPEETGDLEEIGEFGLPDDSEKAGKAGEAFPADLSDFGDFGLPEDMPGLSPESPAEMPAETSAVETAGTETSGTEASVPEEGIGEIPSDLLDGFADDLESDGLPVNETFSVPGEDDSQFDFSTIDLSNAMDLRNKDGPV